MNQGAGRDLGHFSEGQRWSTRQHGKSEAPAPRPAELAFPNHPPPPGAWSPGVLSHFSVGRATTAPAVPPRRLEVPSSLRAPGPNSQPKTARGSFHPQRPRVQPDGRLRKRPEVTGSERGPACTRRATPRKRPPLGTPGAGRASLRHVQGRQRRAPGEAAGAPGSRRASQDAPPHRHTPGAPHGTGPRSRGHAPREGWGTRGHAGGGPGDGAGRRGGGRGTPVGGGELDVRERGRRGEAGRRNGGAGPGGGSRRSGPRWGEVAGGGQGERRRRPPQAGLRAAAGAALPPGSAGPRARAA